MRLKRGFIVCNAVAIGNVGQEIEQMVCIDITVVVAAVVVVVVVVVVVAVGNVVADAA